jgi:hypothetical protein
LLPLEKFLFKAPPENQEREKSAGLQAETILPQDREKAWEDERCYLLLRFCACPNSKLLTLTRWSKAFDRSKEHEAGQKNNGIPKFLV